MVRSGADAAEPREVLHGSRKSERVEAAYISQANIGHRGRVAGYRALIDKCVEVKAVVPCPGPQIQDRCKILIHAKCRQFLPVSTPELFRSLCPNIRRQIR